MLVQALALVFVGFGLALCWYGLRPVPDTVRLARTPVQMPLQASEGEFIACRGVAREREGTVRAPFSRIACLCLEYEVTERQLFALGLPPWGAFPLDDGVAIRPFELDGLVVSPSARRFSLDVASETRRVASGAMPPARIRAFLDRRNVSPTATLGGRFPGMGTRHYVERRIQPDTEYLVAGRFDGTALSGPLILSDKPAEAVVRARLWRAAGPTAVGLLFVSAGIGALLV